MKKSTSPSKKKEVVEALPEIEAAPETGPSDAQLKTIATHVSRALTLQELLIPKAAEELEKLQSEFKTLQEITLPNLLTDANVAGYTYTDRNDGNWQVSVENDVKISYTKENFPKFKEYLEENEEDDLIKRKITIKFGRDQVKLAMKFIRDLAKRKVDLHPEITEEVNWQTLNAWAKTKRQEAIDENLNPDEALPPCLNVFKLRYAKLEPVKQKKGVKL